MTKIEREKRKDYMRRYMRIWRLRNKQRSKELQEQYWKRRLGVTGEDVKDSDKQSDN